MKRKNGETRAIEFSKKASIIKKFGVIDLTENDIKKLEVFFNKWLENNTKEPNDSLYIMVGNMLLYNSENDLYETYMKIKNTKIHSKEWFILTYGYIEGVKKYSLRNDNIKNKIKYKPEEYVDKFLSKRSVSSFLEKSKLSNFQLTQLNKLLQSRKYREFEGNECIIIDIISTLSEDDDIIFRYDMVKKSSISSYDYYQYRYGRNSMHEFTKYKNNKSSNAKKNFKNSVEYWTSRGYSEEYANEQSIKVQHERNKKAIETLKTNPSCRTVDFWILKGYSLEEAESRVNEIQARDLTYYINKYGEDVGVLCYENMIKKRSQKWDKLSDEEKQIINKKKGKTHEELINIYGEYKAYEIIKSRFASLQNGSIVSNESISFFQDLEKLIPEDLKEKSITGYKTKERWINVDNNFYFLDYVVNGCVIEYNGSFWHCDNRLYEEDYYHPCKKMYAKNIWEYDNKKIDNIKQLGYNVLVVWSYDIKKDRQKELAKCKEWLLKNAKI